LEDTIQLILGLHIHVLVLVVREIIQN